MKDLLTEESLKEIETAFTGAVDEKSSLHVEAALAKQDEEHATKVQKLLEAIDADHTKKLVRIVEAVTDNHTTKLKQVISKYEGELQTEAVNYKGSLVNSISNYLDLYLEKAYPQDMLEEAVTNKRCDSLVSEMRKVLGVDMALAKESIKEAVLDGRTQISEANKKIEEIVGENQQLKEALTSLQRESTLVSLTKDLPEDKKKYIYKILGDKKEEFVKENFQYTLDLFDKETETELETLKEEAKIEVKGNVDPVIEESVEPKQKANDDDSPMFGGYMNELGKY